MVDRVIPIKHEATDRGGSVNDTRYTPANPNQDGLEARAFYVQNDSTRDVNAGISRDSLGNLTLWDLATGVKTLESIAFDGHAKASWEGFESAIFPPGPMWSTPGDLCPGGTNTALWERTTTSPISGSASAKVVDGTLQATDGSGMQAFNTRAHLQLDHYSHTWFRLSFRYKVALPDANYDYLKFYIESEVYAQWTGGSLASPVSGTCTTTWLPPGHYRFVWLGLSDNVVVTAGQYVMIDEVRVETFDIGSLPVFFDHGYNYPSTYTGLLTESAGSSLTARRDDLENGVWSVGAWSSTVATPYYKVRGQLGLLRGRKLRFAARIRPKYIGANLRYEIGLTNAAETEAIQLVFESAVNATNWRIQAKSGVNTTELLGPALSTTQWVNLVIEISPTQAYVYVNGSYYDLSSSAYLPALTSILFPRLRAGAVAINTYGVVDYDYISFQEVLEILDP